MSAAEFARTEGHRDGYLEGLSAALAMTNGQAERTTSTEGHSALTVLAHNIADRIAAGGCPEWKDAW